VFFLFVLCFFFCFFFLSAATSPIIHSLGIRHIVNASGFENKFEAEGVKYVNINLWDSPSSNIKGSDELLSLLLLLFVWVAID
jgi:hypothetical protein